MQAVVAAIGRLNPILLWFVMAVELGALLMLLNANVALILLAGAVILHVGILAASGILFWKWMIRRFDSRCFYLIAVPGGTPGSVHHPVVPVIVGAGLAELTLAMAADVGMARYITQSGVSLSMSDGRWPHVRGHPDSDDPV